jgi:GNAT superfamily N-acetyltransferase
VEYVLFKNRKKWIEELRIAVDATHRRRGYASNLLGELTFTAKQNKPCKCYIYRLNVPSLNSHIKVGMIIDRLIRADWVWWTTS